MPSTASLIQNIIVLGRFTALALVWEMLRSYARHISKHAIFLLIRAINLSICNECALQYPGAQVYILTSNLRKWQDSCTNSL